ncbi:hypothetical protein EV361DRAFT_869577 [Lentinula raphanica]|uniref:Uncharacterized protein n=1 Tax=Lentinula raphanica TaxID=153919 RepID=A0AA38NVY6_9AGAR|nr:hypothetical protein F5878DRAFT_647481 [Lentinula raphanica]KAJ3970078.1 hypothetical protein EV361DRAFT_869577 [Lentinula raphanica]
MPQLSSRRRRLSPSLSLLPGYLFNGKRTPEDKYRIRGKTFGLYFSFASPHPKSVQFPSENHRDTAPASRKHHRHILFRHMFSPEFQPDNLFTTLIIVEGRRYVVSGTYDQCLEGFNQAVDGIGCNEIYKGDIGICFLGKSQRDRFLDGLPRYRNADAKQRVLRKVLKSMFGVNHVEIQ